MEWLRWVPVLMPVALVVYMLYQIQRSKDMAEACQTYFGIYPKSELTQEQLDAVVPRLLDLHRQFRAKVKEVIALRETTSSPFRGGKLVASSIAAAEFEVEKAEFSFNSAMEAAAFWAPKGFKDWFAHILARQILAEENVVVVITFP